MGRRISIKSKIILLTMLTSVTVLLLIVGLNTYDTIQSRKNSVLEQGLLLAQVVAINVTPALEFQDNEAAELILSSLSEVEGVVEARLYDMRGKDVASFRSRSDPLPLQLKTDGHLFTGRDLYIKSNVQTENSKLGQLVLRLSLDELRTVLRLAVITSAVLLVAGTLAALILISGLQQVVSAPILELLKKMRFVGETKDYSIRAEKKGNDEIGDLVDEFNKMIAHIQARDVALAYHQHNLEAEVTERTKEISEKNRELLRLNEVKNAFMGMAAHDLRGPLGFIKMASGMLCEGRDVNEKEASFFLTAMRAQSRHMLNLLDGLLDVAQIESGSLQLIPDGVSLSELLEEAVHYHERIAHRKASQILLRVAAPCIAECDRTRIRQVIDNLVSNAVKYSPHNSTIVVVAEDRRASVRVSVIDEGPGLTEEDMQHLFQDFSKLSAQPTGGEQSVGLGLAIAKRIIGAHGGRIGAESEPGNGATFWFVIPKVFVHRSA